MRIKPDLQRLEGKCVTFADGSQDENRLIAERREKLHALKAESIAYPNDFRPNTNAAELQQRFADKVLDDTRPHWTQ